jgi:hypothetical protein
MNTMLTTLVAAAGIHPLATTNAVLNSLAAVLLVAGAASCGAWGETMRQLALTQLGEPDGPEEI